MTSSEELSGNKKNLIIAEGILIINFNNYLSSAFLLLILCKKNILVVFFLPQSSLAPNDFAK